MDHLLTVAQGLLPSPPALESPGGISYWLLEQSLISSIVLGAVGALLLGAMVRRGKAKRGLAIGGGVILVAVAVNVLGGAITTDREAIVRNTRALVDAAGSGDTATVETLLAPDVQVRIGGERMAGDGREILLGATEALQSRVRLTECVAEDLQAVVDGDNAGRSQVNVRAVGDGTGVNFSWWKIDWRKDASGEWQAWGVDCLLLNGRRPGVGLLRMFE